MENIQILNTLWSWDLFATFLLLAYLFRNRPWSKSSSDSIVKQDQRGTTDESRDFIKVMDDEQKNCIVFFGSQTGTAEAYASRLTKEGKSRFGLEAMVANLEDYDYENLDQLPSDKVAIFILASYGEGEPTDNAADFYSFISNDDPSFSQGTSLDQLHYAAFGLGNKTYEHYNEVVRKIVAAFDALGASRIGNVGEGDDGSGTTEEDFITWKEDMWTALASKMNLTEFQSTYEPTYSIVQLEGLTSESVQVYTGEPNESHLSGEFRAGHGPFNSRNPYIAPISSSWMHFSSREESRRYIHIDVDVSDSGLEYEAGDHLAVWPSNATQEVDRLLQALGLYEKRHQVVSIQSMDAVNKIPFPAPTTYDTIMRYYLEICGPVSRHFLADLIPFSPNETVKKTITKISSDKALYHSETHFLNLACLLQRVGDGATWSTIPVSLLIENLPKLQPRFYSISSSPLAQPTTVSITVAVKSGLVPSRETQDPFRGVASNFLLALHRARVDEPQELGVSYDVEGPRQRYAGGLVPIHLRHSSFKLPKDPSRPIIMVGPGTGVAPFRGFVQERAEMMRNGETIGQMLLFFGLYVQHRLKQASAEVYGLVEQQAHVYVCGDAVRMAKDVSHTFVEIISEGCGVGLTDAEKVLKDMRAENRYQEDVWA
ncbi:cytochrome p450 oxidoreductase [Fusarium avenaceum]|nr:cytochrome p450 oxidoreductase [Fusarium avenaceum]